MPTEAFPPASRYQPESDGDSLPSIDKVDRSQFMNYSEQEQYLHRRAAGVALEVFGEDLSRPGMFFTETGSDHDVPYMVVCEGEGSVTSYHLFDGGKAGGRGLNGVVITEAEALNLRAAALGRTIWEPFTNL